MKLTHPDALKFAHSAAKTFGVGPDKAVEFNKDLAKKDIAGEGDTKANRNAEAKKLAAAAKKAAKDLADSTGVKPEGQ